MTPATGDLNGAAIIVTGVGRRGQTGEVVAAAFAKRGASLVLIDRDAESVKERASAITDSGSAALAFGCDLTDVDQTEKVAQQISSRLPSGISAVVHMAGGYVDGASVAATDPSVWHRLFAINLTTAYVASRAFLPLVRQRRGAMVFFASASALPGASVSGMAAYAAAKGGVVTLMRAIAAEEKAHGVRANALAPQAIRTAENLASMGADKNYVERETIAAWVLWLCSRESGPVNGQVIRLG